MAAAGVAPSLIKKKKKKKKPYDAVHDRTDLDGGVDIKEEVQGGEVPRLTDKSAHRSVVFVLIKVGIAAGMNKFV